MSSEFHITLHSPWAVQLLNGRQKTASQPYIPGLFSAYAHLKRQLVTMEDDEKKEVLDDLALSIKSVYQSLNSDIQRLESGLASISNFGLATDSTPKKGTAIPLNFALPEGRELALLIATYDRFMALYETADAATRMGEKSAAIAAGAGRGYQRKIRRIINKLAAL